MAIDKQIINEKIKTKVADELDELDELDKKMNAKKLLGIITASILAFPALSFGAIITLPEGFVTDMLAYAGQLFTDTSLLVLVVIGLPVGFWVIRKVISLARAR